MKWDKVSFGFNDLFQLFMGMVAIPAAISCLMAIIYFAGGLSWPWWSVLAPLGIPVAFVLVVGAVKLSGDLMKPDEKDQETPRVP